MALRNPDQQRKLIEDLFTAALAELGEFDPELQEHANPVEVWNRFHAKVEALGLRIAIVDADWDLPFPVSAEVG